MLTSCMIQQILHRRYIWIKSSLSLGQYVYTAEYRKNVKTKTVKCFMFTKMTKQASSRTH